MLTKLDCIGLVVCGCLIVCSGCATSSLKQAAPVLSDCHDFSRNPESINLEKLSDADQAMVKSVLGSLEPIIHERRQQQTLAWLTFEDLYALLDENQQIFLRAFAAIYPNQLKIDIPYQAIQEPPPDLVKIESRTLPAANGQLYVTQTQFLPKNVYFAYINMTKAMQQDIEKTLYVASGYRSPAYQLYLFLFYLKNHEYSILETRRFVAWPGFSEHGNPRRQAIDFVNEQGIDGQDNAAEFEALEEYRWLLEHAGQFGFELSYPKGGKMAFEPWHWRYRGQ
ncbi:MAG: M15 family metallopeptidase [Sedimentisphaerales bacterium]|nr:M15 family metallopeptidase [Sedimentisphaerales bacterium]